MGGVDPSDAGVCVGLAASCGRANGGLYRTLVSSGPPVAAGSPAGAACFTSATARGKTQHHLVYEEKHL